MNQCYLCELSPIKSLIPKTVGVKSFFLGLLLKNDATAKYNFKYLQKKLRSKRGVKKNSRVGQGDAPVLKSQTVL